MKRLNSEMAAADLIAWQRRNGLSPVLAAAVLGISRRQFDRMCNGYPIRPTIAKLCRAIDLISRRTQNGVQCRDL